jgi:GNAT superfamily N-acetyltransferase
MKCAIRAFGTQSPDEKVTALAALAMKPHTQPRGACPAPRVPSLICDQKLRVATLDRDAFMRDTWVGRDGTQFELRPIQPNDFPRLVTFARRLSFGTRYFRYGRGDYELGEDHLRRLCSPDPAHSVHLLVLHMSKGVCSIVGSGRIVYGQGDRQCELTLTVSDSWQRRGVGRRLLDRLIEAGREKGQDRIIARILATNRSMLALVGRRGFMVSDSSDSPAIKIAELAL